MPNTLAGIDHGRIIKEINHFFGVDIAGQEGPPIV
jgi:hypothetical protein